MTDLPSPPSRPRPDRRTGRPRTLDRAAVVDAALRVLDTEGLDAVTIRRVAQELGTSGTALYTYVRDKNELVDLLLDRVLGEVDVTSIPAGLPWPEQIRAFARELRRVFSAHRDIAGGTLARVPQGENALGVMNEMLGRMRAAHVSEEVMALGADLLALYVGAVSYEQSMTDPELAADPLWLDEFVAQLRGYFEQLPADRFPHIVALAGPLTSTADRFEFGLDVIVRGLESRAADETA
jgi:TetR/AcrR family transcriptional regulator, tetracycline repressor protein